MRLNGYRDFKNRVSFATKTQSHQELACKIIASLGLCGNKLMNQATQESI